MDASAQQQLLESLGDNLDPECDGGYSEEPEYRDVSTEAASLYIECVFTHHDDPDSMCKRRTEFVVEDGFLIEKHHVYYGNKIALSEGEDALQKFVNRECGFEGAY
jgi:hypothetical protein